MFEDLQDRTTRQFSCNQSNLWSCCTRRRTGSNGCHNHLNTFRQIWFSILPSHLRRRICKTERTFRTNQQLSIPPRWQKLRNRRRRWFCARSIFRSELFWFGIWINSTPGWVFWLNEQEMKFLNKLNNFLVQAGFRFPFTLKTTKNVWWQSCAAKAEAVGESPRINKKISMQTLTLSFGEIAFIMPRKAPNDDDGERSIYEKKKNSTSLGMFGNECHQGWKINGSMTF